MHAIAVPAAGKSCGFVLPRLDLHDLWMVGKTCDEWIDMQIAEGCVRGDQLLGTEFLTRKNEHEMV